MNIQAVSNNPQSLEFQKNETKDDQKFLQALEDLDAYIESQRKTEAQKRQEEEAERVKRAKDKRINELQLRISTLRSRVNMGYENSEHELSALQNQLFLLQLFG